MKQQPPEKKPSTGILTLLEKGEGQIPADSVELQCVKISDTIYQCLNDCNCRHRFNYESLSLCSWPHPDNPARSPKTIPCVDTKRVGLPDDE